LGGLVKGEDLGYYFSDRVLLSNEEANFSTEPDDTFCSFAAVGGNGVSLVQGNEEGDMETEGRPDMVLGVVNRYSVCKDTKSLRNLCCPAGIPEYWLVDARKTPLQLDILRWKRGGYSAAQCRQGWLRSNVFGRSFLLETQLDRLGHPQFFLRLGDAELF